MKPIGISSTEGWSWGRIYVRVFFGDLAFEQLVPARVPADGCQQARSQSGGQYSTLKSHLVQLCPELDRGLAPKRARLTRLKEENALQHGSSV